ncbi:MAG: ABC transporter [endosymbiont of Galathealinum brachiosum]|uniref:ABC transporter n=1 Tax=endosymbiont of Galathealinum brachiosum TaxID=2200906 RepID=A0A370DEW4_9GAMM|nr:MAG: ABC transporter [endosymbiont of Galathealinum brachiosum]
MKSIYIKYLILLTSLITTGCASVSGPSDPRDPLESYNRAAYAFNDGFDEYLLKPVAKGYDAVTPDPVIKGVNNFFSNLDDVIVIFNDLLQLKPLQFASDTGRFIINSTLGLAGLIDWASDMNMPKHQEDFGQTLGYWGVPQGPYLVIPFWGPSTIRDGAGLLVDSAQFDPVWQEVENGFPMEHRERGLSWGVTVVKAVDTRASLLKAENILNEAALDRYTFIREAFLQRRQNLVYDGNPPEEEIEFNEDELFDFDEPETPSDKPGSTR